MSFKKLTNPVKTSTILKNKNAAVGSPAKDGRMKFIEFTVHTTTEGSELIADIFWNYTNYGVTVCDVNDIIALQSDKRTFWDYMDDDLIKGQSDVLVKCFLPLDIADENIRSILADIELLKERSAGIFSLGTLETSRREIEGDDWIDVWKKYFRPLHIGGRVVICPEWIAYEPKDGEVIVKLDSNMAFGTGEHETTSMCLELLQEYLKEGDTVIDVGCGSGILGIAALKLGAKFAYMTDIDYVAVKSATHNSELNGVADRAKIDLSDLLENADVRGEVMTANITADILCRLCDSIPKNLKEKGTLILSGIIEPKLEQVIRAYEAVGLTKIRQIRKGEWFALAFKK